MVYAVSSKINRTAATARAAHDELLDDLIRRFEEWVERG